MVLTAGSRRGREGARKSFEIELNHEISKIITCVNQPASPSKAKFWLALALGLITLALYSPSVRHQFLTYDDQQYVTENQHVKAGITLDGLRWACGARVSNWHPLTWFSHMLDCQLYGLNPFGHHLTNIILHAANAVLLFLLLFRLWPQNAAIGTEGNKENEEADMTVRRGGNRETRIENPESSIQNPSSCLQPSTFNNPSGTKPSIINYELSTSAIVAALFAWHPLHVESVAWIAERKDLLSAFFFLLTLMAYVRYGSIQCSVFSVQCSTSASFLSSSSSSIPSASGLKGSGFNVQGSRFWYLLALVFFALGLMSKPMLVTIPFILLLLDVWPLGRLSLTSLQNSTTPIARLLWEKLAFLLLSAATCALTVWAQEQAMVSRAALPLSQRVSHAVLAYAHYLIALFWPTNLAVYYPYGKVVPTLHLAGAALLLVAITGFAFSSIRTRPYLLVGWVWFLGMLIPVIGIVQVGDQAWADRYTYLPSIGIFIALVFVLADLFGRADFKSQISNFRSLPKTFLASAAVVFLALLITTEKQLSYWKDTRTLFEHTVAVTRNNNMALTLLGSLLAKEGKFDEAMNYYEAALRIEPRYPEARFFRANVLEHEGKLDEAISEYQRVLWHKPTAEQTHISLGAALAKERHYDAAVTNYLAALKLNPESAVAHNNLARVLQSQGKLDEAVEHYSAAIEFEPTLAQAHNNLGVLLLQKGKLPEGVEQLQTATRLNPVDPESRFNLGLALIQSERWQEAADVLGPFAKAATDPRVHYQYALALEHLKKTREAMAEFAAALLLQPDYPDALDGLSWMLATSSDAQYRNGPEAVRMSERVCELTSREDPQKLKTLSAAYAEAGRFQEAIHTAQAACEKALRLNRPALVRDCENLLASFQIGRPWRTN